MDGAPSAVRTTCPYCGVGCGVRAEADGSIVGDPTHPANRGRLCSKGSALGDTLGLEDRLLSPLMHGHRASWDEALDFVAQRFAETLDRHGRGSVAFYVSGQFLTEDYYVANKLMKGFLGSAAIDTNSRLCMASTVAGHRRAFGEDVVPGCYEDFELADLVVLSGSNTAWCHPVLYQRLTAAAAERNGKVVVLDPRRTATCASASLHLALKPGTDVLLWNGLLAHLARSDALDRAYVAQHTVGFEAAVAAAVAEAPDIAAVAAGCGLAEADVRTFYEWFTATPRVVSAFSQGVNQSSHGTDKVNALINCHLATGRIGKPGMGPFSLTGQPNAMGGREVGGLANQLAAHLSFENPADIDRVRRFWNAPHMATAPGPKAVDMFEAVADGRIQAIWIAATNPAVSMPNAARVREGLARCPLVVVSDVIATTDTARYAHVLLPAAAWGEKSGTVTNSERRISRQRAFREPPGEAKPDWWAFTEVGRRMGFADSFAFASAADVFREHAALSAFENGGERLFNLSALQHLSDAQYDALAPVQWPAVADTNAARLLAGGQFPTPDGRARFVAVHQQGVAYAPSVSFPLHLNTGRARDQWHTMAQTGRSARLARHAPEPTVDVHPADAAEYRVSVGGLARIASAWGTALARVRVTTDQSPGGVFLPMHWSDAMSAHCVVGKLTNPATDATSGQPELKHTPVAIAPVAVATTGFLLTRERLQPNEFYWTRARVDGGYVVELADIDASAPERWVALLGTGGEMVEFSDRRRGMVRMARIDQGLVAACLFAGPPGSLPTREWLLQQFAAPALADSARATLLSARAAEPQEDRGRIVCSCFEVGINRIIAAIRDHALTDAAAVGQHLRAGTNCGSCLPELKTIVAETRALEPA